MRNAQKDDRAYIPGLQEFDRARQAAPVLVALTCSTGRRRAVEGIGDLLTRKSIRLRARGGKGRPCGAQQGITNAGRMAYQIGDETFQLRLAMSRAGAFPDIARQKAQARYRRACADIQHALPWKHLPGQGTDDWHGCHPALCQSAAFPNWLHRTTSLFGFAPAATRKYGVRPQLQGIGLFC